MNFCTLNHPPLRPLRVAKALAMLFAVACVWAGMNSLVWAGVGAGYPGSYVKDISSAGGGGANILPGELENIAIVEKLGAQIPLDATLLNEAGQKVQFRDFLQSGRPLLVNFGYFNCPRLCSMVMNGMVKGMKDLKWIPGQEYEVLTININPQEGPELAKAKKANYLAELGKAGAEPGWHFLSGEESQVRQIADAVGFPYRYDASQGQYAHDAGIFTVSPDGKVMRYLYGIEYKSIDIRLALLDASKGRSMSLGDRFVTLCYRYDANAKGYVLFAKNFMRTGGYVVLFALAGLLGFLWRKELKRKAPASTATQPTAV